MKIYFVYYANDYHYDNGTIIGASTDEKECKRIAEENRQRSGGRWASKTRPIRLYLMSQQINLHIFERQSLPFF